MATWRNPDVQLDEPQPLRKYAVRIRAERLLDRFQRPELQRFRHQLLAPDPLPDRRRVELDLTRRNRARRLAAGPPEEHGRFRDGDVRTLV
jgi:hypothetical protein